MTAFDPKRPFAAAQNSQSLPYVRDSKADGQNIIPSILAVTEQSYVPAIGPSPKFEGMPMNQMSPIKPVPVRRGQGRAATLMGARMWHSYAGAFFAPAILFFSVTGAFQTFNLHKAMLGYHPPAVLQALASMHKNQNLHVKYVDDPSPKTGKHNKADKPDDTPPLPLSSMIAQWMLKVFAALVSVGLIITTALGLYMSWQTSRRRTVLLCFAAGMVLPMLMMLAV